MHEVLKLLIQLLPVVGRNHEVQLATEKAAFLVNHPDLVQKFGNDLLPVLIQVSCQSCCSALTAFLLTLA